MFEFFKRKVKVEPTPVVRRKWVVVGPAAREIRRLYDVYAAIKPGLDNAARYDLWAYVYEIVRETSKTPVTLALSYEAGCKNGTESIVLECPPGTDEHTVFEDKVIVVKSSERTKKGAKK